MKVDAQNFKPRKNNACCNDKKIKSIEKQNNKLKNHILCLNYVKESCLLCLSACRCVVLFNYHSSGVFVRKSYVV